MKKLLLLLIVGAMLIGAGLALNITHLTAINKSGKAIDVKGVMVDKPGIVFFLKLEQGTKDFPVEKVYSLVSGTYEVEAWAVDNGSWTPCFGFADDEYWDDWKAVRIMTFGKGARKMIFTERNCVEQPEAIYNFWIDLKEKLYEYNSKLFNYQY